MVVPKFSAGNLALQIISLVIDVNASLSANILRKYQYVKRFAAEVLTTSASREISNSLTASQARAVCL
jgi:hypothetical protein